MTRGTPFPDTVTLHVAFRIVKRGGRKEMQMPDGAVQPRRTDSALVKALARAFRWKRMLDSGEFASISELAEREGIASSYMTRVLRLTLLAPDIVEAVLDGKQGSEVTLARLLEPFPVEWEAQLYIKAKAAEGRRPKAPPKIDIKRSRSRRCQENLRSSPERSCRRLCRP
ncbi:hypothetical protein [Pseudoponticoccus marisrubri]|uniref:hypothetical protein n=1 Tax=Pseudoponticoccus marisrubri TaxID=1685382 RepID=UPI000B33DFE1